MSDVPADPFVGPDAEPRGVLAELEAATDGLGKVTLSVIEHGGHQRRLAWWPVAALAKDPFEVARSPDWLSVAVLSGGELITVDVASGAVVASVDGITADWGGAAWTIAWDDEGRARAVELGDDGTETVRLADGWNLRLQGSAIVDGGFSGGHHETTERLMFDLGASEAEMAAAYAELWAREAREADEPVIFRLVLERAGVPLLGYDEASTPAEGVSELYWPPVVGPGGVLLRRGVATLRLANGEEGEATGPGYSREVEMQEPWLVAPTGEVTTVPAELGVAPLVALPDGRFLLPGSDPLWLDGRDEPLGVLAPDGTTAPLLVGADAVTPGTLVRSLAPDLLPGLADDEPGGDAEESEWEVRAAGLGAGGSSLVLLLAEGDFSYPFEPHWLLARVSLDGDEAPVLLARGQQVFGTRVAIAL